MARQIAAFRPKKACLIDTAAAERLRHKTCACPCWKVCGGACEMCAMPASTMS
jgi:hypothetical protein